jgi:hypothetical protein
MGRLVDIVHNAFIPLRRLKEVVVTLHTEHKDNTMFSSLNYLYQQERVCSHTHTHSCLEKGKRVPFVMLKV